MKKLTIAILFVLISGANAMAEPKPDVEELMNALLPFGEQMLEEHGEFIPYGGAMKRDGKIVSIAGDAGDEHPSSQEIIDLLKDSYRLAAKNGEYKATA